MIIQKILVVFSPDKTELLKIKESFGEKYVSMTKSAPSIKLNNGQYHNLSEYDAAFIHESDARLDNEIFYRQALEAGKTKPIIFFSRGQQSYKKIENQCIFVSMESVLKYGNNFLNALENHGWHGIRAEGFNDGQFFKLEEAEKYALFQKLLPWYLSAQLEKICLSEQYSSVSSTLSEPEKKGKKHWEKVSQEIQDLLPDLKPEDFTGMETLQKPYQDLRNNFSKSDSSQFSQTFINEAQKWLSLE